jgi:hypothetical protein
VGANQYPPITDELFEAICERLATGEPLRQICRDEGMPTPRGFNKHAIASEVRMAMRADARRAGFDALAEGSLEIVDAEPATIQTEYGTKIDPADVANRKLRAEHRMRLLAKWDRERYGDHLTLAGDPESPLQKVSDDQLDARIAALAKQIRGLPNADG